MHFKQLFLTNHSRGQIVFKNTVWLIVGEVGGRLARFGLIVFAARVLGAGAWGVFAYAISLSAMFTVVSDWGFNALITRYLSQEKRDHAMVVAIFSCKLATSSIMLALIICCAPLISTVAAAKTILPITAAIIFFDTLRDTMVAINRARELMEREALVKIVTNGSILLIGTIGILYLPSISTMAYAYAIGSCFGLLLAAYFVRDTIREINISTLYRTTLRPLLRMSAPFAVLSALTVISSNTNTILLGIWSGATVIGFYAATTRTVQLFHTVPNFFSSALFPQLSRTATIERAAFVQTATTGARAMVLFSLPLAIGGTIVAHPLVVTLFGNSYTESGYLFSLLIWSLPFVFFHIFFNNILIADGKQRLVSIANGFGVVVQLTLALTLIPTLGGVGAMIATIGGQAVTAGKLWYVVRHEIPFIKTIRSSGSIFLASAGMLVAILAVRSLTGNALWATIPIGVLIYSIILILTKEPLLEKILKMIHVYR